MTRDDEQLSRCAWSLSSERYRRYHDLEWGWPEHDERKLFEMLVLEGAQAGLSWSTILDKRDGYRRAFDHFDVEKVARYGAQDIERLLQDRGIVRNRLKVAAAVQNARSVLEVRERHGSFSEFVWELAGGAPVQNAWVSLDQVPAQTPQSEHMSKTLRKLGFKFVGPTICYAYMQAVGMVNDHLLSCFRHAEVQQ